VIISPVIIKDDAMPVQSERAESTPRLNGAERKRRGFDRTAAWVFDLDNTLYPAECNLFAQVDQRMGAFIADYLEVPLEQARHLQKSYYRKFGTTLSGLMQLHGMEPGPFLEYVHDIDLACVPEHPDLAAALARLPGRKLIFTNGSRRHAERVAEKLGILDQFEDICSIEACEYVPKPQPEAFDRMVRRHGVSAERSAMFEDIPHNLEVAHVLGMTTVLVDSDCRDHHAQPDLIASWTELPEHVHHVTRDLCGFLNDIKLR
jgi:putative hydrolase of the HAD superfamily